MVTIKRFNFVAGFIPLALFVAPLASASFKGTIQTDTHLYKSGDTKSEVLEDLSKGAIVDSGNTPQAGFYHVRSESKKVGWVPEGDLSKADVPISEATTQSSVVSKSPGHKHPFGVRLLGNLNLFKISGVIVDDLSVSNGIGLGGELFYSVTPRLSAVLRVEKLSKSVLLEGTSGNIASTTISSMPISVGAEWTFYQASRLKVTFSGLAGLGIGTGVKATISALGTSTSTSASALTALGLFSAHYTIGSSFSVFGEAGYRYLKSGTQVVSADSDPSSAVFFNSTYSVNLSGPVLGAGIGYTF